jgi:hypothetical protein
MKVSEQALCECRAAIVIASPLTVEGQALDHLITTVQSSFESVLDNEQGEAMWRKDRPMMLLEGACIGSLGSLISKLSNPNAKTVSVGPLMASFEVVRAGCNVRMSRETDVKMFTKYCSMVQPPSEGVLLGAWEHIATTFLR